MDQEDKNKLPASVKHAVGIVESVQGDGAVSDFAIELMVKAEAGEINDEEVIKEILEAYR